MDAAIADQLTSMISDIDSFEMSIKNKYIYHFNCASKPGVTLHNYLRRIIKYMHFKTPTVIVFAVILIKRLLKSTGGCLTEYNVHRLYAVAILLAVKVLDDRSVANDYFAEIVGFKLADLNAMEVKFIKLIQYDLFADTDELLSQLIKLDLDLVI